MSLGFLERFFPDEAIESVYAYDFDRLYSYGYRLILFDIDNTLVPHGADADARAVELFKRLKQRGFQTCLVSNNSRARVESFATAVGADGFIYKAGKPADKAYLKAIRKAGRQLSETVFFGDQLFTDIYGAKRIGIRNIVVRPIDKKEEIQIVFKRILEKPVYSAYFRSRLHKK